MWAIDKDRDRAGVVEELEVFCWIKEADHSLSHACGYVAYLHRSLQLNWSSLVMHSEAGGPVHVMLPEVGGQMEQSSHEAPKTGTQILLSVHWQVQQSSPAHTSTSPM